MILQAQNQILWKADWRPFPTQPKGVRQMLNAVVRHDFEPNCGYVDELIERIHSLALIVDDVAIVSTCGKFVAKPVDVGAKMGVEIRRVVTDRSPEYVKADAWADAIRRHQESQPVEYD